jgi:hypothetical protein
MLLNPLLKASADLLAKQIQYEKTQILIADGERALELIGRAIRMAGYTSASEIKKIDQKIQKKNQERTQIVSAKDFIVIEKSAGYRNSDSVLAKHELSNGLDFDCAGNPLTKERTRNQLAHQGFKLERQASAPKGSKVNGGSLICQSLDRQGRIQHTMLMSGVNHLAIKEITNSQSDGLGAQKLYRVALQMTDGNLSVDLERTFSTRNLQ